MPRASSASIVAAALLAASSASARGVTKGPWVQQVTPTSVVVRFELDAPAPASVQFGAETAFLRDAGARAYESPEAKTVHSVTVTGLEPATRYSYSVNTASDSKLALVTTAPKEDSNHVFRFLVYGDNRTDDAAHAAVVRAMAPMQADFFVNTGDFVENGASRSQWQTFFDIESPLMRERPIFSCVGNHELMDGMGADYIRYFGPNLADGKTPPEHIDSTFRWAKARFFLLNGMVGWKSGADRAWLEKALAESDKETDLVWRIVVIHFGPWSSGPHGNNPALHEAGIPALLKQHKIDLVISGHDHIYERGSADGMAYLVSGGGGAPTYRVKAPLPSTRKVESVRHFIEAAVTQVAINFAAMRPDGSVIERCALRKDAGWDCDVPSTTSATASGSAPTPAASASTEPSPPSAQSRCGCEIVGGGSRRSAFVAGLLAFGAILGAWGRRSRPRSS